MAGGEIQDGSRAPSQGGIIDGQTILNEASQRTFLTYDL